MNLFDIARTADKVLNVFGSGALTVAALSIIATARRLRRATRIACRTTVIAAGALMAYLCLTNSLHVSDAHPTGPPPISTQFTTTQ
ncbi:hypothetical protein [Mycobacterium kyorinense]|uniref:Uncharacterized protein n=1 Tax=Mycobacterium kyorinense TaxID=487514 RepID=A0A1X1YHT2_9MYCO|nr:hypothetical protein [Mycobacterium kyorinense]ORW10585.1 hypothetical protein AWC14_20025 [Mycobacterium kyorinense]